MHSDQGVQYTCSDWRKLLADHNLEASMSRRGNCHDNAVAESFFSMLKTERIKRGIFKTRNEARAEMFNYIEFYYNHSRRHGNNNGVSPVEFERQYFEKLLSVQGARGAPPGHLLVGSISWHGYSFFRLVVGQQRLAR